MLGDGTGGFAAQSLLLASGFAGNVCIADMTADAITDLVVTNSPNGAYLLTVYRGGGGRQLRVPDRADLLCASPRNRWSAT